MWDALGKMQECGKYVKMRDFPHDFGTVDTYVSLGQSMNRALPMWVRKMLRSGLYLKTNQLLNQIIIRSPKPSSKETGLQRCAIRLDNFSYSPDGALEPHISFFLFSLCQGRGAARNLSPPHLIVFPPCSVSCLLLPVFLVSCLPHISLKLTQASHLSLGLPRLLLPCSRN